MKTLYIPKAEILPMGDKTRLLSNITLDGQDRAVWFEVSSEYARYLVEDRADAFLCGLMYNAFHDGFDVVCESPVSSQLLYNIENLMIPMVNKAMPGTHKPIITATGVSEQYASGNAVATGISCGVDSLFVLRKRPEVTHLTLFNVGAYPKDTEEESFKWQIKQSLNVAREVNKQLVVATSNIHKVFARRHMYAHKYANAFAIFMLRKLWGTYYHGTAGYDFRDAGLTHDYNETFEDSVIFDAAFPQIFSVPGLNVISEGLAFTRYEKMQVLIDDPIAQKYLDCCFFAGKKSSAGFPNCGRCSKCMRTLLILDALDGLDAFKDVFDVKFYKSNKYIYLRWLLAQRWLPDGDHMIEEVYYRFRSQITMRLKLQDVLRQIKFNVKHGFQNVFNS